MPETSTTLIVVDLIGTFVFAISGALVAVRKELDVFGVLVLAMSTGLGGGFLRDVLIGDTPPAALVDWRYLLVPLGAGLLTFFYHPSIARGEVVVNVFDALGLALFVVAGATKAMHVGLGPVPSTLMGLVTGIGGGMLRDVLAGRVPIVLRPGLLYAIPAAAGAAITAFGLQVGVPTAVVAAVCAGVCGVWRILAIWRRWQAPVPHGSASV
jgi:uncharacterized membrane protein YeiH